MNRAPTAWRGAAFNRCEIQPRNRATNRGIVQGVAAGGSRERLRASQFYRPQIHVARNRRDGQTLRWVIFGNRLQVTDRTASLKKRSPPGVGPWQIPHNSLLDPRF